MYFAAPFSGNKMNRGGELRCSEKWTECLNIRFREPTLLFPVWNCIKIYMLQKFGETLNIFFSYYFKYMHFFNEFEAIISTSQLRYESKNIYITAI